MTFYTVQTYHATTASPLMVRSVDPMAHVGGWISAYPQQTERRRDSPAEASRRQRQSPDSSRAHGTSAEAVAERAQSRRSPDSVKTPVSRNVVRACCGNPIYRGPCGTQANRYGLHARTRKSEQYREWQRPRAHGANMAHVDDMPLKPRAPLVTGLADT